MFATLVNAIRADAKRQSAWVKAEIERQRRYSTVTAAMAAIGALAVIGAIVVALIAAYFWIAAQYGAYIGLAAIGAVLLFAAIVALAIAYARERPAIRPPPPLETLSSRTVLHTLTPTFFEFNGSPESAERVVNAAAETVKTGPRSAVYGTLALAVVAGLVLGRKL